MNNSKKLVSECIEDICKKYDIAKLEELGIPANVIYTLIAYILGMNIFDLKLNKNNIYLTDNELEEIDKYIKQMVEEHIPIQYITGRVKIYNEEYIVTPSVLIPRSDTEVLIDTAIRYIKEYSLKNMLDICTGSGVVGISISKNSNIEKVDLVDISEGALDIAKKNIELNKAGGKCNTYLSDIFSDIPFSNLNKYDIIVGNPPYIESDVVDKLSDYVKSEPRIALDGGKTGLDIYIRIFNEAKEYLKDNSFVILEIGYNQGESIKKLLSNNVGYELLEIIKDINSKDRVVVCRFHRK